MCRYINGGTIGLKTVAILGHTSMVGSMLLNKLKLSGKYLPVTIGRDPSSDIVINFDTKKFDTKKEIPKIDTLFHCISSFESNSTVALKSNYDINVTSSLLVIDIIERFSIDHLIYVSSVSIYEKNKSYYGLTKYLAENIYSSYCQLNFKKFLSLRFSQINDSYGKCIKHQAWFGRIIRYTEKGLDLNMSVEKSLNNFIHVDDVARILIGSEKKQLQGFFDVLHPQSFSYHEIARKAYKIFNNGGKVIINPNKLPFHYFNFKYDDLIYQKLEFYPEWDIEKTIKDIKKLNSSDNFGAFDVE